MFPPELAEPQACADPDCDGMGQPETDGDRTYLECDTCGYTFGYRTVTGPSPSANTAPACAVGVDEFSRAVASEPARRALAARGPLLQIGRRHERRPAD